MTFQNQLRDAFAEACCHAHLPVRIEMGSGLTPDHSHSCPADVFVAGWERGKPKPTSTWQMKKRAKSEVGHVFPLSWEYMVIGVEKKGHIFLLGISPGYCFFTTQVESYFRPLWAFKPNLDEGYCKSHSSQSFSANRTDYLST